MEVAATRTIIGDREPQKAELSYGYPKVELTEDEFAAMIGEFDRAIAEADDDMTFREFHRIMLHRWGFPRFAAFERELRERGLLEDDA